MPAALPHTLEVSRRRRRRPAASGHSDVLETYCYTVLLLPVNRYIHRLFGIEDIKEYEAQFEDILVILPG